jgi:hypothetical protein
VTLAIQLLGCFGAVLIIALLVHGDTSRPALGASAAVLATIVVSLLGIQKLWPNLQTQRVAAKGQQGFTFDTANTAGGRALNLNADFVEWARTQSTSNKDTFYVLPPEPTIVQWMSYRMLPRLTLSKPKKGTWLVFYNTTPRKAGYQRSQITDLRTYQPGFAMARLVQPEGSK